MGPNGNFRDTFAGFVRIEIVATRAEMPGLLVALPQCTHEQPSGGDAIVATLARNGGIGIAATRAQNSAVAPNETPGALHQLSCYWKL